MKTKYWKVIYKDGTTEEVVLKNPKAFPYAGWYINCLVKGDASCIEKYIACTKVGRGAHAVIKEIEKW